MLPEILHANPDTSPLGRARKSLVEYLRSQDKTVALIEGCTGGALANAITIPGATKIIRGGITPYSRDAKIRLGIPQDIIDQYGEYSLPVAQSMAQLSQRKEGTDVGIGIVGNVDTNGTVYTAYILADGKSYNDAFILEEKDRRQMNNGIILRVLTTANSLLHGQTPNYEIPRLGEPADFFVQEHDRVQAQAEEVIDRCRALGLTIGTMESCSGLAAADKLTNVRGSQDVFQAGILAYDENVKQQLGVPFEMMARGGVYSKEVAANMAESVIDRMGVDVAFATTGVLDVWDTRPYHTAYAPGRVSLAIARRGLPTWSTTKQFPVETRDKMKLTVTSELFGRFIDLSITDIDHSSTHLSALRV